MNRILPLLLACACWLAAGRAQAELSDPAQIQTEAYINLVQADQSLDAGRLDEALSQYQAARDYYLRLAKDFPGWEPRVIQYRKTYCDNQIADVQRRQSGGAAAAELPELAPLPEETAAPAAAPENTSAPAAAPAPVAEAPAEEPEPAAPVADRAVEIDYLKSRIASLEEELKAFDTLQTEYDKLAAENKTLQADLAAADQKLADEQNGSQSALAALQADVAKKEEQIQALQQEAEAKKQLDQALNDLEAKVNDLQDQNQRLDKEIKDLNSELDDAEVRADQAELKAKQAEDKLQDAADSLQKAEKETQKARDQKADAEEQLASAKQKADADKADRAAEKTKADKQDQAAEKTAAEPKAEEVKVVEAASPVAATVPARDIPKGMAASDFVRQLLQQGENDAALATVQEARQTHPTDMNLVLIEGITLIRLQRYPEAATLLIDLAKNNPRNAEIHATLGAAMMGAGFYEEARETLLLAVRLDKNLPECLYNLAQLYALVDPKDLKQARKYYNQALNLGLAPDKQLEKALK